MSPRVRVSNACVFAASGSATTSTGRRSNSNTAAYVEKTPIDGAASSTAAANLLPGPSMQLVDSRRLTGPNLLADGAGAILDVAVDPTQAAAIAERWEAAARRLLGAIGWEGETTAWRRFHGGLSLFLTAPVDALYAATEVAEAAWEATATGGAFGLEATVTRLKARIAVEVSPRLQALRAAALRRGVAFLGDDDRVSIGLGSGSISFAVEEIPPPTAVDWEAVHDVPVALVTGTNGKTTTVRLLAAMAAAAGKVPGLSSTDGLQVGAEAIEDGDFAGPGGARRVLRDRRVEVAVLETARGGMLRRGLAVSRATVAAITNVAPDHLGEWGIHDLDELAAVKLLVARVADHLVLPADDPVIAARAAAIARPVTWTSLDPGAPAVREALTGGRPVTILDGDRLLFVEGGAEVELGRLAALPMTLGGAARHNAANALTACAAARRLGIPWPAVRSALADFDSGDASNPGRLNRFDFHGVTAIVDFAHNPHGTAALVATAAALPAARRLVVLGQAGDRSDEDIRELARLAWTLRPDRVVLKELPDNLRGRAPGEVPALLADELRARGAARSTLVLAPSELAAVRDALAWARPGDLLLLVSHEERTAVLALLDRLRASSWRPGTPLPE